MNWITSGHYPHQRRNIILSLLDGSAWLFGLSFVSATTILPVFVSHLTKSPILIGLIPAILDFGWLLPQLFVAPYVQRQPRQYPVVMAFGLMQRLPFVALAILSWLFPSLALPSVVSLAVFFGLLSLRAIGGGIVGTPWQELIARTVPPQSRGRFFSTQQFLGSITGLGGAVLARSALERFPYPQNFAVCFSVAAAGVMTSWFLLAGIREPALSQPPATVSFDRAYLRRLGQILRDDRNFRAFLMSRSCSYVSTMALGFLAIAAVGRFHLSDGEAAVFATLILIGSTGSNLVWGTLADRRGYRIVLLLTSLCWISALLLAAFASTVWVFYIAFALVGMASSGGTVADLGASMEFGNAAERPTYIGLSRTVTAPCMALAPLIGGLIVRFTGSYTTLFLVAIPFSLLGIVMLHWISDREREQTAELVREG